MSCGNIDANAFTMDDHITVRTVCCPHSFVLLAQDFFCV